jgi:AraC family transcriptional regulator of adaptative response/methylated-DNA-[protein]-cysteine methyltransferase
MTASTNDLWRRVREHDARADGLFVYAVKSTGIYCRPSCPSRRPRRAHVEFFPAPAMAAERGYRPCRRCRPDEPHERPASTVRVQRACDAIARAPERSWTTTRVAAAAGASVAQTQRAFRSLLGLSPRDYVAACRHRRFLARLREDAHVTPAIFDAGYGSSSRAYEPAKQAGMTPATYAKGGRGASIDWLTTPSPLGTILVAATTKGVCFVAIGDDVDALRDELARELPLATIAPRPSHALRPFAIAARAVASGQKPSEDVPADIRGTAFQWRVWRALKKIPLGATLTYAELAKAIGEPSAVRAVARACATNPAALFIPCHRVVGADGSLRGYRWGIDVKRRLIEKEKSGG